MHVSEIVFKLLLKVDYRKYATRYFTRQSSLASILRDISHSTIYRLKFSTLEFFLSCMHIMYSLSTSNDKNHTWVRIVHEVLLAQYYNVTVDIANKRNQFLLLKPSSTIITGFRQEKNNRTRTGLCHIFLWKPCINIRDMYYNMDRIDVSTGTLPVQWCTWTFRRLSS